MQTSEHVEIVHSREVPFDSELWKNVTCDTRRICMLDSDSLLRVTFSATFCSHKDNSACVWLHSGWLLSWHAWSGDVSKSVLGPQLRPSNILYYGFSNYVFAVQRNSPAAAYWIPVQKSVISQHKQSPVAAPFSGGKRESSCWSCVLNSYNAPLTPLIATASLHANKFVGICTAAECQMEGSVELARISNERKFREVVAK